MEKVKGFTFIEMLISLLILGLILRVAIPSFRGFVSNSKVTAVSTEFSTSLAYARAEAVHQGDDITVCASNSTNTGCGTNTNWNTYGWIVFLDSNANGTLTSQNNLLQIVAPKTDVEFTTTQNRITYTSQGALLAGAGTYTINMPTCIGNNGRQITLSNSGTTTITYIACA